MTSALRRLLQLLLADSRGLALITAVYLLAGFVMLHYDSALNNEGLIIHYTGICARSEFVPLFFAQKAKPVLAVLYSLPSLGGVLSTMVVHLLISAMALPLVAGFARSLGYALPNFSAIVVAFSPIFFLGGAAGIPNNDAVVGTALVLFLLTRGYPLCSGLILGCLPWVRSEMAPLLPILWLHAIWIEPNRRFAAGVTLFPIAYALAGAVYHHDLLWLVHYPPASPANPNNPMWRGLPIGPAFFLGLLPAVTPVAGLAICSPFGRLRSLERTLLFYMVLMIVLLEVLPIFRIGNFGGSPRYELQVLPIIALFAARSLEVWWEGGPLRTSLAIAALGATAWSVTRVPGLAYAAPIVAVFGGIMLLAWLRRGHAAILVATLLALLGPMLVPGTQIERSDAARYLQPMEQWFQDHGNEVRGPVYTNSQLLDALLQLRGLAPNAQVRFLLGFDHVEGVMSQTNPRNGQREAALRVTKAHFYGTGVIASTLRPDDLPPGTLFALRVDRRLDITLPPEIWGDRLEILFEKDGARMARLRPPPSSEAK